MSVDTQHHMINVHQVANLPSGPTTMSVITIYNGHTDYPLDEFENRSQTVIANLKMPAGERVWIIGSPDHPHAEQRAYALQVLQRIPRVHRD